MASPSGAGAEQDGGGRAPGDQATSRLRPGRYRPVRSARRIPHPPPLSPPTRGDARAGRDRGRMRGDTFERPSRLLSCPRGTSRPSRAWAIRSPVAGATRPGAPKPVPERQCPRRVLEAAGEIVDEAHKGAAGGARPRARSDTVAMCLIVPVIPIATVNWARTHPQACPRSDGGMPKVRPASRGIDRARLRSGHTRRGGSTPAGACAYERRRVSAAGAPTPTRPADFAPAWRE